MAAVGRRRKKDKHLPERVYLRHGAYYYVSPLGTWKRLAKEYGEALRILAGLLGASAPTENVEMLVARYDAEELTYKATKTRQGRRQEFKPIIACFGHMSAEEIESHHVWNYWKVRGRNEQARHEIRALSTLLTFARRVGARTRPNPCFGLQLPQSKSRDRYVTDAEFLLVRSFAPPMVAHAMDLALIAGLDQATIRRLERRHVTDEGLLFERGKTKKLQLIEWNEDLRATVKEALALRPQLRHALICNRKGKPYSANGFQSQWQRVMRRAKKAGLTSALTFHDLRAKSASDAESDQEAADRLGHGDVRITRKTYRRLPQRAIALKSIGRKP